MSNSINKVHATRDHATRDDFTETRWTQVALAAELLRVLAAEGRVAAAPLYAGGSVC